jgi:hypothetical protein
MGTSPFSLYFVKNDEMGVPIYGRATIKKSIFSGTFKPMAVGKALKSIFNALLTFSVIFPGRCFVV